MESTITVKGQVTLPKAVRDQLHLSPGDRVKFFLDDDGHLLMMPKLPTSALKGLLSHRAPAQPVTIEQMDEGIAAAVAARDRRSRQR